jgi:hypothetical protein
MKVCLSAVEILGGRAIMIEESQMRLRSADAISREA